MRDPAVAKRFEKKSPRLLFELYNEPHGRLDAARWNDLAARAMGVVRASNAQRLVVLGPVQWNQAAQLDALRLLWEMVESHARYGNCEQP